MLIGLMFLLKHSLALLVLPIVLQEIEEMEMVKERKLERGV